MQVKGEHDRRHRRWSASQLKDGSLILALLKGNSDFVRPHSLIRALLWGRVS